MTRPSTHIWRARSGGAARSRGTARCAGSSTIPTPRRRCSGWRASPGFGTRPAARCPTTPPRSRRSARRRSSSARRWPRGPTSSARKPRATCCRCRTACRRSRSRRSAARSRAASSAPVETIFAEIDPVPVGSASIAQVHRAVTSDGRQVAVKVLRPGIRERFARDIDTYEWAAAHLEALGGEARAAAAAADDRQLQALDPSRARLAARGRLGLRARRGHARLRRLLHPVDRLGPHQRPGA